MANEIRDAFNATWADGPTIDPIEPNKADIRNTGGVIQAEVDSIRIAVQAAAAGSVTFDTWAKLLANPGTKAGQGGRVTGPDAGTHTDPVVGGTKANIGSYSWSVAPAGWQWVAADDITALSAENLAARDGLVSLDARLDRDYAALSAISGPLAAQELTFSLQRIGKQTTPVTSGTQLATGVSIFPAPIEQDNSTLIEFGFFATGAGTIRPQVRSQGANTNDFTRQVNGNSITVTSAGLKVYTAADFGTITGMKGQHAAFYHTATMVAANTATSGTPYWSVTGPDDAVVVDTTQADNFVIEAYAIWQCPQGIKQRVVANEILSATNQGKIDAIYAERSTPGFTGISGTLLAAGTESAQGHLAISGAEDYLRVIDTYKHTAINETWVTFWIFKRTGTFVELVKTFPRVKVNIGLNDHTWLAGTVLKPGEFFGYSSHASGSHVIAGVTETNYRGFWSTGWTSMVSNKFSDAVLDTTNIVQYRLEWRKVSSASETQMMFDDAGVTAYAGKATVPTQGDGLLGAGSLACILGLTERMLVREINWESGILASVRIAFGVWNGTSYTIVKRLDDGPVAYEAGTQKLYTSVVVEPGWDLIFQSYTGNYLRKTASTPNKGWRYAALPGGAVYPDTFTTTTNNSTDRAEVRITGKVLAGEKHVINSTNSDKIAIIGPSYTACAYVLPQKNWTSYVGEYSDWRIEAIGFSGETLFSVMNRLLTGAFGSYPNVPFPDMGITFAMLMEGYNSWDHPTAFRTLAQYKDDASKAIEIVRSEGVEAVFVGEARRVYGDGGHAVFRTIAETHGIPFIDVVQHTLRFDSGAKSPLLYQGVVGDGTGIAVDYHYGTRTYRMLSAPIVDWIEDNIPDYRQGFKAFRLRNTVTYTDIDEIVPRDNKERAQKWQEIAINHIAIAAGGEQHFDNLTPGAGSYAVTNVVGSEYLKWQQNLSVTFPADGLLSYVLNAVPKNVGLARLTLSDPTIQVYVKSSRVTPTPTAIGTSICQWKEITGNNGVFELSSAELAGCMDRDKIVYRLFKTGGFTITEPKFEWFGKAGKPARLPNTRSKVNTVGAELLAKTTCETITGWTIEGGATASAVAFQAPANRTGFIAVTNVKKIRQTIPAGTNNDRDRLMEVAIESRRFPPVFNSANAYPSTSPITSQTWDDRLLLVELIAPTGEIFEQTIISEPWHRERKCYITIPMRVGNHDLRISAVSDEIEVYNVSVKEVTSTH